MNDGNSKLQPGRRYRVQLNDCCIKGGFTAQFVKYEFEKEDAEDNAPPFWADTLWDNGVTLGPLWGLWDAEEVPGSGISP